tara:strand:+ start:616 stop:831 length:216 start_codon:yes stop_codon:yes gene_type:complete
MKSLFLNIKNLLPYLLLISIYFFFINIEARNDLNSYKKNNETIEKEKDKKYLELEDIDRSPTISIPVIPYN